jgi:hypothetical protein
LPRRLRSSQISGSIAPVSPSSTHQKIPPKKRATFDWFRDD